MLEVKTTLCLAVTMRYYTWLQCQLNPDSVARNDTMEIESQAYSFFRGQLPSVYKFGRVYQP